METRCPICGMTSGKVTDRLYYCPECCVEFNPKNGAVYQLDVRGGRLKTTAPKKKQSRSEVVNTDGDYLRGINYWRLKNGFTWLTLAEFTGYSVACLRAWAFCEKVPDSEEEVQKICSVLGVTPEALRTAYSNTDTEELQAELNARGRAVVSDKLRHNTYNRRRVLCINTGTVYPSQRAAAEDLGLHSSAICKVCKGDRIETNGYRFMYVE